MDDKIQAATTEQENAALSFSAGGWPLLIALPVRSADNPLGAK